MSQGKKLSSAAQRADMCENTARKYMKHRKLPSENKKIRTYRTHADVFSEVWPELVQFLEINASIEAKTLFEYLVSKYPDKGFQPGQLRTLQRRIKKWKAASGKPGSGKAHILCAIAQELIHRGKRICFTSCRRALESKERTGG
jgi:hypothetical protein